MNIDHTATRVMWEMAGDVNGLARALDFIIDEQGQPGTQAVLNALLARSKQLMDAVDESHFVVREGTE